MTELEIQGLKLLAAFIAIPLLLIYLYCAIKSVGFVCELIKCFLDALEWRMRDWIYRFKRGKDK